MSDYKPGDEYINQKKDLINTIDIGEVPAGTKYFIEDLKEKYSASLDELAGYKDQLIEMFYLDKKDKEKLEKQDNYPKEVRNFHLGRAATIGSAILLLSSVAISLYLGGPIAAWSTPLILWSLVIGACGGFVVSTLNFFLNKIKFKPKNVEERSKKRSKSAIKRFFQRFFSFKLNEELAYEKYKNRATIRSTATLAIVQNMNAILNGKNIFQTTTEKTDKKGHTKTISKLSDDYKDLPWYTKIELNSLMKKIGEKASSINAVAKTLYPFTEEAISSKKQKEKENIQKQAELLAQQKEHDRLANALAQQKQLESEEIEITNLEKQKELNKRREELEKEELNNPEEEAVPGDSRTIIIKGNKYSGNKGGR